jgi:hypothetical protein
VADWHTAYSQRTAGLKKTLKPILQAYSGDAVPEQGSTAPACRDLSAEASKVLNDPNALKSPDPRLNQALRDAYILIDGLGEACRSGRDAQVHALIDKISQALGLAAQRLAPYGLTP